MIHAIPKCLRHVMVILVTAGLLFLTSCSSKGEKEPIYVGHIAPLSGSEKTWGEHAKQGILIAVQECNQEEQRIGGQKVAVLHTDSQGKTDQVQAEADRLITVNTIKAL